MAHNDPPRSDDRLKEQSSHFSTYCFTSTKINSSPCYVINNENNAKFVEKQQQLHIFFQPRHQHRHCIHKHSFYHLNNHFSSYFYASLLSFSLTSSTKKTLIVF